MVWCCRYPTPNCAGKKEEETTANALQRQEQESRATDSSFLENPNTAASVINYRNKKGK